MSSKTELCNLATSNLGISKEIANLDTEKSEEAKACRRYFSTAIEKFQRDFEFSFGTKRKVLGLISENPNDEYLFEYEYPSDCVFSHRIISGFITDNRQTQVPYVIVRGDSSNVIYSNFCEAELEYSIIETDTGRLPADVDLAFSFLLSKLIAPRLTAGDPFGLANRAKIDYDEAVTDAWSNSKNEQQEEEQPESELIREMNVDTSSTNRGVPWTPFPDGSTIL